MELNESISRHNYYSFLWHAIFLALAQNFMDVDTIIPAMVIDAGGTAVQVGILTAILVAGGKFSQLFFVPFVQHHPFKKFFLLMGINLRVLALAGMAVLFFFASQIGSSLIIWIIFLLILLFSLSGGFANINYLDILGKSVLPKKRKAFFSIKQVLSSVFVLLSAFFAKWVLSRADYPLNYTILFFIAAGLLAIASIGFWRIREIPVLHNITKGIRIFVKDVLKEIRCNRRLKQYLLVINTQGIGLALMPFLILYAKQTFHAGSDQIGNFLIFKVIGSILSGSLLFYFAHRIRYQYMLYLTSAVAFLIPLLILQFPGSILFPHIFLAGGIVFSLYSITFQGVLLELSRDENRTLYAGLSGAGSFLPVLFPFIGGWIVSNTGFTAFFIFFLVIIFLSFIFIFKLNCLK